MWTKNNGWAHTFVRGMHCCPLIAHEIIRPFKFSYEASMRMVVGLTVIPLGLRESPQIMLSSWSQFFLPPIVQDSILGFFFIVKSFCGHVWTVLVPALLSCSTSFRGQKPYLDKSIGYRKHTSFPLGQPTSTYTDFKASPIPQSPFSRHCFVVPLPSTF